MSQNALIWKHLRKVGWIDPLTALKLYGSFRLAARVSELRAEHPGRIKTVMHEANGKHYARYRLQVKG